MSPLYVICSVSNAKQSLNEIDRSLNLFVQGVEKLNGDIYSVIGSGLTTFDHPCKKGELLLKWGTALGQFTR